ncbi:MAG: hypothetical protein IIB61_00925 [Planctomycetes bacterium]|nr:hypothetical protein [Planctomycetota bacterium]
MHGDVLVLVLAMVLAGAISLLYVLCQAVSGTVGFVGRRFARLFGFRTTAAPRHRNSKGRVCPRANCRRVEHRDARFCGQCGMRLRG